MAGLILSLRGRLTGKAISKVSSQLGWIQKTDPFRWAAPYRHLPHRGLPNTSMVLRITLILKYKF
jgi:hypothetical protein